jgi:2-keto-4-pentenoate hydratase/2-oxohepta-3-ene-1,7-dioic acid hydratase in catechol pathway
VTKISCLYDKLCFEGKTMKFGKSQGSVIIWEGQSIKEYPSMDFINPFIMNKGLINSETNFPMSEPSDLQLMLNSTKIICLAKNYSAHAVEMGVSPQDLPKAPSLFIKPPSSLIGPNEKIVIPPQTKDVHHEVELAIIIGKRGKNISLEDAYDYIFGYTILLDITARDLQSNAKKKGGPWFVAKGFDTFCPIGPVITTTDEVTNPQSLDIELLVNNELRQKGNTGDMLFKIDQIIQYCSSILTLEPGDIIATGTPEGVGPFNRGDSLHASIEKLGTLDIGVE